MSKYYQRLSFKDIDFKIKLSALGKKVPNVRQRKKILFKGSHLNKLRYLLKNTDWANTPLYYQF